MEELEALLTVSTQMVLSLMGVINQSEEFDSPCPNYVWHMDGNHKLIKWKIVTYLSIDVFSRLITFAEASDNNLADTVLEKFHCAILQYGRPIRVRTDHGGVKTFVYGKT